MFAAETVVIRPGEVVKCRTGLCVHAEPDGGEEVSGFNRAGGWTYAAFVWDKSGLAARGLTTLGGVIDDPYTGEVLIVVTNVGLGPVLGRLKDALDRTIRWLVDGSGILPTGLGDVDMGVEVKAGEKLAQLVIQRVELALIESEPRPLGTTERGAKGFASTGL